MAEDRRKKNARVGAGMGVGIPVGVAIGVALDNIGLGIAIGVALGAAIGLYANKVEHGSESSPMTKALLTGGMIVFFVAIIVSLVVF